MQRIDFQIDFVRIIYKLKTKKEFRVRLELQDKEGKEVKREQLDVSIDIDVIELYKMGKFQLFFIAGEEKTYYLPFFLHFIANDRPIIKRKIPIRLHKIHQHYLDDFQQIGPLEQIYTFEQGEIIYKVTISKSEPIIDEEEIRSYDQRLCVLSGSTLGSLIDKNFLPQLSKGEQTYSKNELKSSNQQVNLRISRLDDTSKLTSKTKAKIEPTDSQDEDTSERGKGENGDFLSSWQQFNEACEEHEVLQQISAEKIISKTKDRNLSFKLIFLLTSLGFIVLLFNAFQGPQASSKKAHQLQGKPKKAKTSHKQKIKDN